MKISILNLAPLRQGESFKDAIDAMIRLAKKADVAVDELLKMVNK